MATTAAPYSSVLTLMAASGLNFLTGDAAVCLATNAYTPSQTGHATLADITHELTDASYSRVLLDGKTSVYSAGTLTLDADDTTFPALVSTNIRFAIFAMLGATDADSPLIGYWDLGANQNANVNDFKLIYHAAGFITITL